MTTPQEMREQVEEIFSNHSWVYTISVGQNGDRPMINEGLRDRVVDLLTTTAREAKREVLEEVMAFNTQQAVSGDPMNGYEQYDEVVSPELYKFLVGLLAELNDGEVK